MSDRPQGEGWWLASDGRWYPPESRPAPPPAPAPPWAVLPQARLSTGLHTTVRVFLYVSAGFAALAVIALANAIPKLTAYWEAPLLSDADELAAWEDASALYGGALGILALAGLVLGILLMVWGSQAYRSLGRTGAEGRSWSPGWAVGGWFIPLASLVIPRLVLSEIERIAHPANGPAPIGDRWRRQPLIGAGLGWWIGLVIAGVVGFIGVGLMGSATEAAYGYETIIANGDAYRNGMVVVAVAMGLFGVAQILGAVYFRELGERLLH